MTFGVGPGLAGGADEAALGSFQAGQAAQRRRLAAAGRAEQDGHAEAVRRRLQGGPDDGGPSEALLERGLQSAHGGGPEERATEVRGQKSEENNALAGAAGSFGPPADL